MFLFTSITVVKRKWFPLQETLGRKIQIWSSLYLTLIWSRVIPFINGVQSDIKNNVEAIYVVCMTKNKTYCFFEKYIKTREINLILIKLFYDQPLTINLIDISTISYLNWYILHVVWQSLSLLLLIILYIIPKEVVYYFASLAFQWNICWIVNQPYKKYDLMWHYSPNI